MTDTLFPAPAAPGAFRAACRKATAPAQRGAPMVQCDETFTDGRAFVAHMREAHGVKLLPDARRRVRSGGFGAGFGDGRGTAVRMPAGWQPGDAVTFRDDRETRTGTVWSAAPMGGAWVVPDAPAAGERYVHVIGLRASGTPTPWAIDRWTSQELIDLNGRRPGALVALGSSAIRRAGRLGMQWLARAA